MPGGLHSQSVGLNDKSQEEHQSRAQSLTSFSPVHSPTPVLLATDWKPWLLGSRTTRAAYREPRCPPWMASTMPQNQLAGFQAFSFRRKAYSRVLPAQETRRGLEA